MNVSNPYDLITASEKLTAINLADGENHNLALNEQAVILAGPAGAGEAATLRLPNCAEARGRIYSITMPVAPGANSTVTVSSGDEIPAVISKVLDAADDSMSVYSDGYHYHIQSLVQN